MTIKRTSILRRPPEAFHLAIPVKVAKPAKGSRKRRCKACFSMFVPDPTSQVACGPACGALCALVVAESERKERDRKADRARKLAMKIRAQNRESK